MIYTNKYNIPGHICKWLESDSYDYQPGVLSATTLISPARAFVLKKLHRDELTMDYSDMIALRYGTAIHDSLEKVGVYADGDFKEKRFFAEIMGFQISGKMDAVLDGVIRDNKSTSVWKPAQLTSGTKIRRCSTMNLNRIPISWFPSASAQTGIWRFISTASRSIPRWRAAI